MDSSNLYESPQPDGARSPPATTGRTPWIKWTIFGVLVVGILTAGFLFREQLTLQNLARYESQLRDFQAEHPMLVFAVAFVIYVAVTALSLPGAAAMTIVLGWLLHWWALPLVSFASTSGATLAFLSSRYLLRDSIEARFGERLKKINEALQREGAFYLFTLRLIPAVPFFVLNVVMGLTPMRVWTYWWVSQVGMLAGTAVFVYAGVAAPSLNDVAERGVSSILSWDILLAFALLGIFPLAAKWTIGYVRGATPA